MSRYTDIRLADLAPPQLVDESNFSDIKEDIKQTLSEISPELALLADIPSEPVAKLLDVMAYREWFIRKKINLSAKQTMVAFATGNNLEHLAALVGVSRQINESDDELRQRIPLAFEEFSIAGTHGGYISQAKKATSTPLQDVKVYSPSPGKVDVYLLSKTDDGFVSDQVLNEVEHHLISEEVRPITDEVTVKRALIQYVDLEAKVEISNISSATLIKENIKNAVQSYFNEQQRINTPITRAGIIAAMHREGVNNVYLTKPETDLGSGFNKNSEKDLKDALMDYFNSQEKKNEPVTTDGLIEAVKNLDININTGICYFCQFSCEFAENTHNELIISLKTDVDALASTLKGTLNSDLGEKCVRGEDESDADFFLRVNDLNLSRYANQ